MSVTRVGFLMSQVGWIGGRNYVRNLLFAIHQQPAANIRPVIFAGEKDDLSSFEGLVEIVRSSIYDRYSLLWFLGRLAKKFFFSRDYLSYFLLVRHRIDVISHFPLEWGEGKSPIPTLAWIADFQHMHLPGFFSDAVVHSRNINFRKMIQRHEAIVLSSYDALNDLHAFCPDNMKPVHVLHFLSCHSFDVGGLLDVGSLESKYELKGPWFHLPNQFWKHKNHKVVIEALSILKAEGYDILVVATGDTEDYRNPDYFSSLKQSIRQQGLEGNFRILGMIPYEDMLAFMYRSIAVVNPSLFEGWSSTVEECKTLGKRLILSDIAVHREQSPKGAVYFKPEDVRGLAGVLLNLYKQGGSVCLNPLPSDLDSRVSEFACSYEKIILSLNKH